MRIDKQESSSKEYIDLNDNDWLMSRQSFVKTILLSGITIQLPWLQSCGNAEENFGNTNPLTLQQFKTVREIFEILFPADGNGPSALEINADKYLLWVLRDEMTDPKESTYIVTRLKTFIEKCKEKNNAAFLDLSESQKNEFVAFASKQDWGKKLLSRLLNIIFEALLLDPIYGGNTNKLGWTWLEHDPGSPRPTKENSYPTILQKNEI